MVKTRKNTNTSIIEQQFNDKKDYYESLGSNVSQALNIFLKEEKIPFLSVTYRTKDMGSFVEKIKRKNYNLPFDQIEDISGIRIICYYQSDIPKICDVIKKEFDVIESQNKETLLEPNEFGYRSFHFIVKIKNDWLSSPNYRNLKDLKVEIQIRTILMHAWAEIEHKLAYKKIDDIPKQFKRQLSRISAKLEEADEQFEKLKNDVSDYRSNLISQATNNKGQLNTDLELNLDNLQAFLDLNFPEKQKNIEFTSELLEELREYGIKINTLTQYYQNSKDIMDKVEKEESEYSNSIVKWTQSGAVRTLLDLNNDKYFSVRQSIFPEYVLKPIEKYRKK